MKTQSDRLRRRLPYYAIAAVIAVIAATAAQADTESGKLMMSGYTVTADTVSGAMLASHEYEAVIDRLAPHTAAFASDEVASSTNLCVAYAVTHRVSEAREACSEAVQFAKADQPMTLAEHKAHDDAVAVALANQATVAKLGE